MALDRAASLIPALNYPPSEEGNRFTYVVQRGYCKVADLYRQVGDAKQAQDLLLEAEKVPFDYLSNQLDSLIAIQTIYRDLGMIERADDLLLEAARRAEEGKATLTGTTGAQKVRAVIMNSMEMQERQLMARLLPVFAEVIGTMPTPGPQVEDYLRAAKWSIFLNDATATRWLGKTGREYAHDLLVLAKASAERITDEKSRISKYNSPEFDSILGGLAAAGYVKEAESLARAYFLTMLNQRNVGFQSIGKALAARDDFPNFDSASIDTDGDARPDFFHPFLSADPALERDDDSDGDGIPDIEDRRPFFHDFVGRA